MKIGLYIAVMAGAFGLTATPQIAPPQQTLTMGHATELVTKALPSLSKSGLAVTTAAFKNGDEIPNKNTQYGGNEFPGLSWSSGPAGTRSYVVIVQGQSLSDPNAVTSIHLTLFNISAKTTFLQPGMTTAPAGSTYGPNVHGLNQAYVGPHAHPNAKNGYHYQILALDTAKRRESKVPPAPGNSPVNVTLTDFLGSSKRKFGPLEDSYLKLYPASNDDEAALQSNESARDNSRISTYLWALDWIKKADKPVYTYFWTHRPTGDPAGAHHASEILFVFNNLYLKDQPWTDEDRKIADTMSSHWANFIANGDPNGAGLPNWQVFDPKAATVMELGDHLAPMPVASPEKLEFWKRFFATQEAW